MLDELDALLAEQRAAGNLPRPKPERAASPRHRLVAVKSDKVKITYWSQVDQQMKTRWTTCIFS